MQLLQLYVFNTACPVARCTLVQLCPELSSGRNCYLQVFDKALAVL